MRGQTKISRLVFDARVRVSTVWLHLLVIHRRNQMYARVKGGDSHE
jgi:hypothetical protein